MNPVRLIHALAVASLLALIVGIAEWTKFSALGLAAAAPLLLPLRGLVRGSTYTSGWASMLVVIYCSFLLAEVYAQPQQKFWPLLLSVLAAVNFLSLILYVRLRARQRAAGLPAAVAASPAAQTAE